MRKGAIIAVLITGLALVVVTAALAGTKPASAIKIVINGKPVATTMIRAESANSVTQYCVAGQTTPASVTFTATGYPPLVRTINANLAQAILQAVGPMFYAGQLWVGDTLFPAVDSNKSNLLPGASGPYSITKGACSVAASYVPQPPRTIYCSAAGNTNPFTGAAITPGTALDLWFGQPDSDSNYKGATPANFYTGSGLDHGLTCNSPGTATGKLVDSQDNADGSEGAVHPERS